MLKQKPFSVVRSYNDLQKEKNHGRSKLTDAVYSGWTTKDLLATLGWRGRIWYRYYNWKYKHGFEIRVVKYLFTTAVIAYVIAYVAWKII